MSLYQFSRIALKNFKHRNISLSKNDHCNLELSENIQFEKYNQSSFFNDSENLHEYQSPKVVF